ncbi:hypothetical protein E2C01_037436 [Portunus trituberculatus]|uniref:Uncharacterized protein n=1 Tax=Portunus trituberculatus TaxID=210409 RepID=A0A5B7FH35_PORTR|nr:hypothetical protein [Portunus trituberculatus]
MVTQHNASNSALPNTAVSTIASLQPCQHGKSKATSSSVTCPKGLYTKYMTSLHNDREKLHSRETGCSIRDTTDGLAYKGVMLDTNHHSFSQSMVVARRHAHTPTCIDTCHYCVENSLTFYVTQQPNHVT